MCTRTRGEGKCRGYVQVLNWQYGIASRGRLAGKTINPPPPRADNDIPKPAVYLFVQENGIGESTPPTAKKRKAAEPNSRRASAAGGDPSARRDADKSNIKSGSRTETVNEQRQLHNGDSNDRKQIIPNTVVLGQRQAVPWPRPATPLYAIPSGVRELLSFYEWQFSRTTVTWDIKVNPWKSSLPMVYTTACLLHAVTALSRRHYAHLMKRSEGSEVLAVKHLALATFNSAIRSTPCEALIATSLSLIGLEVRCCFFSISYCPHALRTAVFLPIQGGNRQGMDYISQYSVTSMRTRDFPAGESIFRAHTRFLKQPMGYVSPSQTPPCAATSPCCSGGMLRPRYCRDRDLSSHSITSTGYCPGLLNIQPNGTTCL